MKQVIPSDKLEGAGKAAVDTDTVVEKPVEVDRRRGNKEVKGTGEKGEGSKSTEKMSRTTSKQKKKREKNTDEKIRSNSPRLKQKLMTDSFSKLSNVKVVKGGQKKEVVCAQGDQIYNNRGEKEKSRGMNSSNSTSKTKSKCISRTYF